MVRRIVTVLLWIFLVVGTITTIAGVGQVALWGVRALRPAECGGTPDAIP